MGVHSYSRPQSVTVVTRSKWPLAVLAVVLVLIVAGSSAALVPDLVTAGIVVAAAALVLTAAVVAASVMIRRRLAAREPLAIDQAAGRRVISARRAREIGAPASQLHQHLHLEGLSDAQLAAVLARISRGSRELP